MRFTKRMGNPRGEGTIIHLEEHLLLNFRSELENALI